MTHGGIRWHVSVHDWPLILIPVSIRSSDVAFHVPSSLILSLSLLRPCPSSANADGERVSIGIGYRTTNAPFTDDNHPRRSPESLDLSHGRSRIIILLLIHGIANRGRRAAPRRAVDQVRRPGKRIMPRREIRSALSEAAAYPTRRADKSVLR